MLRGWLSWLVTPTLCSMCAYDRLYQETLSSRPLIRLTAKPLSGVSPFCSAAARRHPTHTKSQNQRRLIKSLRLILAGFWTSEAQFLTDLLCSLVSCSMGNEILHNACPPFFLRVCISLDPDSKSATPSKLLMQQNFVIALNTYRCSCICIMVWHNPSGPCADFCRHRSPPSHPRHHPRGSEAAPGGHPGCRKDARAILSGAAQRLHLADPARCSAYFPELTCRSSCIAKLDHGCTRFYDSESQGKNIEC